MSLDNQMGKRLRFSHILKVLPPKYASARLIRDLGRVTSTSKWAPATDFYFWRARIKNEEAFLVIAFFSRHNGELYAHEATPSILLDLGFHYELDSKNGCMRVVQNGTV